MKWKGLEAKFNLLKAFLLWVSSNKNLPGNRPLYRFVLENANTIIEGTIFQGVQLLELQLEDLPLELVENLTDKWRPFDIARLSKVDDASIKRHYRDWIRYLILELEVESKRQKKLTPSFKDGLLKGGMSEEELRDKFPALSDFFGYFNSDMCDDKEDIEVIKGFVKENESEQVKNILSEGKDLLSAPLDKSSANWISSTTCNFPYLTIDGKRHLLEHTPENYYKWVEQVVEELEAEAKRQGKL